MTPRKPLWWLFAARTGALKAFFRRHVSDRNAAGDLTQEVYLRLLRSSTESIDNPEAYLFAVARNLITEHAVMKRRQMERETLTNPFSLPDVPVEAIPEYELDHESQIRAYLHILGTLPARQQMALKMFYEQELSQVEIARQLGVSRQMVQKILAQALACCRERMGSGRTG